MPKRIHRSIDSLVGSVLYPLRQTFSMRRILITGYHQIFIRTSSRVHYYGFFYDETPRRFRIESNLNDVRYLMLSIENRAKALGLYKDDLSLSEVVQIYEASKGAIAIPDTTPKGRRRRLTTYSGQVKKYRILNLLIVFSCQPYYEVEIANVVFFFCSLDS